VAIIKSSVKLIIRQHSAYQFKGPVLALGIPEVYATHDELVSYFKALSAQPCRVGASEVVISNNPTGRQLGWVSFDTFLKMFGISEVLSVDIPGCEHKPDFIHDLNLPFPAELMNRFNLVIDPGTIEHIFDIKAALTNVVRCVRVGGVVIHQVPVYSYNGGYYSLNPNVMNDFYSSNGFGELKTFIIMWDRYWAYTGKNRCYPYSEALLGKRYSLADRDQCRYAPHMLFFARKQREVRQIVNPIQFSGQYMAQMTPSSEECPCRVKQLWRWGLSRLYDVLPYNLAFSLESRLRREKFLYLARRNSFRL
jgi:hypothetical protein